MRRPVTDPSMVGQSDNLIIRHGPVDMPKNHDARDPCFGSNPVSQTREGGVSLCFHFNQSNCSAMASTAPNRSRPNTNSRAGCCVPLVHWPQAVGLAAMGGTNTEDAAVPKHALYGMPSTQSPRAARRIASTLGVSCLLYRT